MRSKTLTLLILIPALMLTGCAQPGAGIPASEGTGAPAASGSARLSVFAAASLTDAFGGIGKLFEAAHPGVTVAFNFAGSQQLAQQINEGAQADIFASANSKQMDAVIQAGGIAAGAPQTFARNRLVVIYPQDNPGGLVQLKDLGKPGLKLVFAANEVPAGQYSLDYLDKAAADPSFGSTYKDDVLRNVVSYENDVRSVLAKVALGEADAGIVYASDISGADGGKVGRIEIPDALNVIASYPIAVLKESRNAELAQAFIDLVLSPQGQAVLAQYKFIPAK